MPTPNKRKSKEPKGVWLTEMFCADSKWHVIFARPQSSKRAAQIAMELENMDSDTYRVTRYIPAPKNTIKKGAKKP